MKKILTYLLMLCLTLITLASCAAVKFDISFVVDGKTVGQISTSGKEIISLPDDPEKEGYTFKGWFWDENSWELPFTANSLLDAPLTNNMKVYAYFVEHGYEDTVTLKFNTMGGSTVETQTLKNGTTPTEPADPTFDGYYFCGWYLYPDFQTLFTFDQPLTSNTTIYAKWAQVGGSPLAVNDYEDIVKVDRNVSLHDIYRAEDGRYFIVYKLGTMKNIIFGRVTTQSMYNAGGASISWSKTYGWEESITNSIENSLSFGVTTSIQVEVGAEAYGASTSVTQGLSITVEASTSVGYAKTRSIMAQATQGGSQNLDGFEKGRYYDMFVVGSQNVYQYFIYNTNGQLEGTAITAAEISSGLMPLSSENAIFDYEEIPKIEPLSAPDFSLVFATGHGTSSSPYYIDDARQLFATGFCPNAHYKLACDIDLSKFKLWQPIGASSQCAFTGTFDGNGKTIKNLNNSYTGTALSSNKVYGLFGYVTGQISNVKLSNIKLEVSSNHEGSGWIYAGALAAHSSGLISNISASGCSVIIHRDASSNGIIVGHTKGTVQDCNVTSSALFSNGDAGLVIGSAKSARITNNNVSSGSLSYYASLENRSNGGIVGYMEASTISNCNVSSTKFILAGSDGAMHSYNIFGAHYYCKLQPSMGYVVGTSVSSTLNVNTLGASGNSIDLQSDASLVGNTKKNESKSWFREHNGKVGTSR